MFLRSFGREVRKQLCCRRGYHEVQLLECDSAALRIPDSVDKGSSVYKQNYEQNVQLVSKLRALVAQNEQGVQKTEPFVSLQRQREKHVSRNKLLVRARVNALIDPGSPFLELSQLCAHEVYLKNDQHEFLPSAGLITGIGYIHSTPCMVVANDATVKGGVYYPLTVKKHLRAQEIAKELHLPCVYLVDSGGANLEYQADVFPSKEHFGRIFYNQSRMSSLGIPQVSVVLGSCTAGGAYLPAMSDESGIVHKQGTIFLAGPPLVHAATGLKVSAEKLGGGRLHALESGVTDHLLRSDHAGIALARRIIQKTSLQEHPTSFNKVKASAPLYNSEELLGIASDVMKIGVDARQIIARIVDKSELHEFKREFGRTLICGFSRIHGFQVALIANQKGVIDSDAACKAAQFMQLCEQRNTPVLFLHNVAGFVVGPEAEKKGIAKHGAKLVTAVSNAKVYKLSVVIGGSYGAGNYGMCGRAYAPSFLFSWPNSHTAVMGAEQANMVIQNVTKAAQTTDISLQDKIEKESTAVYGSARLWDDGVIDPLQTRSVIGFALRLAYHAPKRATANFAWRNMTKDLESSKLSYGIFRM